MGKRQKQQEQPAPSADAAHAGTDVALVLDRTADRRGLHIVRRRGDDQPLEVGVVRPLEEGKNIDGEVVSLRHRPGAPPFVCDVKTELAAPRPTATSAGPPQVATDSYRAGWDAIWGEQPAASAKLN